jgi:hypothetical protein
VRVEAVLGSLRLRAQFRHGGRHLRRAIGDEVVEALELVHKRHAILFTQTVVLTVEKLKR